MLDEIPPAHRDHYLALVDTADRSCAARTRPPGWTGSRSSSTTSAPRWRSASPIPMVPSPDCVWPSGCAGSASYAATAAKSSRRSAPCSAGPTPTCPPRSGPRPSPPAPTCSITSATIRRSRRWPARPSRSAATSPMPPSPPTPCPRCAGSGCERGDLPAALAQIDEAVALAQTTGDPRLMADLLGRRAAFKGEAGDLDAALADNQESIALSRAAGDNYRLAITLANLGVYELAAGELRPARAHLREASTLADNLGYRNMSVGLWQHLGLVDLADGDPRDARRHFLGSLDVGPHHRYQVCLFSRRAPGSGPDGRRGRRPRRRRHSARRRRRTLRAGRTGFRGHGSGAARPRSCPSARHAGRCRVRGRLPSRPHAQPGRRYRPGHRHRRARSWGFVHRHRARRRSGVGRRFRRPTVGTRAGDRGAAGRRGDRRPDRRAAVPVGQHGADRIWSGSGTRPAPAGAQNWSATPSRPASKRPPLRLRADSSLTRRNPPPEGEWAVRPTLGGLDGAARPLLSRLRPGLRSVYCSAAEAETRTSVYPRTVTAF